MMKNSISMRLLLLVVSLNLACGLSQPPLKKSVKVPERQVEKNRSGQDAYLIYSTVINNLPKNKSGYVICGRTTTVPFFPYKNLSESIKNLFQGENKTINSEVLTSFLMKNKESVNLEARFELHYPYTLINLEKVSKVFKEGDRRISEGCFPDALILGCRVLVIAVKVMKHSFILANRQAINPVAAIITL